MLLSSVSSPVLSLVLASIAVIPVTLLLHYFCSVDEKRIKVFRAANPDSFGSRWLIYANKTCKAGKRLTHKI